MAFPVINPFFQFFDDAGEPLASGTVETYESGTSTPKVTYQEATLTTPNATTIDLDAAGRCSMFVDDGESFKYIVKDADGVTIDTQDGVKSPVGTQAGIGALLYPRTDAEIAAGVTPTNLWFTEGHVERYATWASSSTDFTTAFQSVAAVARNKPGLTIQFTHGRTYTVWPLGSGSTLFDLDGATGVTVEGNGALISAGNVSASAPVVFNLQTVNDVVISSLRYTQSYSTLDPTNGGVFFLIRQDSHRITLQNIRQLNGRSGIEARGEFTTDDPRSDQITALNCYFENVYYPQSFQASGDQYFARGIKTIKCGRGYFPYNLRQHDVEMFSQHGGAFDDCLLKVYANPSSYNKLEQIRLRYYSDGRASTGSAQSSGQAIVSIDAQQNTVTNTAAQFTDIDIQIRFEPSASPATQRLLQFRKFDSAGAVDTNTTRAHIFANIRITGLVQSWQNAADNCIDLFSTADGYNWTGDSAYNIRVAEMQIATSNTAQVALRINGQPFSAGRGVIIENFISEGQIIRENWDEQKAFDAVNVTSATIVARASYDSYSPTWTTSGGGQSIGNGTVVGRYTRRGDRIKGVATLTIGSTTNVGSGEFRLSLPAAAAAGEGEQLGAAHVFDSGTAHYVGTTRVQDAASYAIAVSSANVAPAIGAASPIAVPANGDIYRFEFDYIAAP